MRLVAVINSSEADLWAASPIAADVSVLPPTMAQVDVSQKSMFEDAEGPGAKRQADGVEAELKAWEQMPHVFQTVSTDC